MSEDKQQAGQAFREWLQTGEMGRAGGENGWLGVAWAAWNAALSQQAGQAVTLTDAEIPKAKPLPDLLMASYHEAVGWNACRDAMLAKAAPVAAEPVGWYVTGCSQLMDEHEARAAAEAPNGDAA